MQKYLILFALIVLALTANAQSGSKNFVLSRTFKKAGGEVNNVSEVQIQVNYLDGLGRPLQTVNVAQSPTGADLVVPVEYDDYGRELKKFLPYTVASDIGGFRSGAAGAQQAFYSTSNTAGLEGPNSDLSNAFYSTGLESSVLRRPLSETGPGIKSNPASISYGTNAAGDVKLYTYSSGSVSTSGNYVAGRLFKKRTVDEETKEVIEFTDINGLLICKKVGSEALTTYYVYDDLKRLRAVLQPQYQESGATLDEFAFLYDYDSRGRMISKKLPGVAKINMVYDIYDRLVLSQDGNQSGARWSFTKYDIFNRVIMTGEIPSDKTRDDWQTKYNGVSAHHETVSAGTIGYSLNATSVAAATGFPQIQESHVLLVNYYDNYAQLPSGVAYSNIYGNGKIDNARSYRTGGKARMLTSTANWLASAIYYDSEYRVVQTVRELNGIGTGAVERVSFKYKYDLAPLVAEETIMQQLTGPTDSEIARTGTLEPDNIIVSGPVVHIHKKEYEYDHADRLLNVKETLSLNGGSKSKEAYTVANKYDELGQLKEKWQHSVNGTDFRRKTAYTYNIRGWLTEGKTYFKKEKNDTQDSSFFAYKLSYVNASNTAKYSNGNISKSEWSGKSENTFKNGLAFSYDGVNRLTSAANAGGTTYTYKETETGITYDKNGNIKTLTRGGVSGNIDQLTYNYGSVISNKLLTVSDGSGNNAGVKTGTLGNYTYDTNGNMTKDVNRNAVITYNYLNLPNSVKIGTNPAFTYEYDATGTKHKYAADSTFKYEGGFEYNQDNAFKRLTLADGQLISRGGALELSYYVKDHLGNIRVVFDQNGKTLQKMDYYPFGLEVDRNAPVQTPIVGETINRYLYSGKESQPGTGYLDYGARMYMPEISRWGVFDKMAEPLHSATPYSYCLDNPLVYEDAGGELPILINGRVSANSERGSKTYWTAGGSSILETIRSSGIPNPHSGEKNEFFYVDGDRGAVSDYGKTYADASAALNASDREMGGYVQAKRDFSSILQLLSKDAKTGKITEQIQVYTHSRGGAFGAGYVEGLLELIRENATLFADPNNVINLVVNLAPHQSGSIPVHAAIENSFSMHDDGDVLSGNSMAKQKARFSFDSVKGTGESHKNRIFSKVLSTFFKAFQNGASSDVIEDFVRRMKADFGVDVHIN